MKADISAMELTNLKEDSRTQSVISTPAEPPSTLGNTAEKWMQSTTAHGIPHIASSPSFKGRILWSLVVIVCFGFFLHQCYEVYGKYVQKEKITSIGLVFENIEFPAATICNLNPYKRTLIRAVPEVDDMLNEYDNAVSTAKVNLRVRRQKQLAQHVPVFALCDCPQGEENVCVQLDSVSPPTHLDAACICDYEPKEKTAWPCHKSSKWQKYTNCTHCIPETNLCSPPGATDSENKTQFPCVCYSEANNNWLCMWRREKKLLRLWQLAATTTTETPQSTTKSAEYKEAMGFEGVDDLVTLNSIVTENLISIMANLPEEDRVALSHEKHEFVTKCSFDGKQCDISDDFKLLVDPVFGNCYTFNYATNRTMTKAGPVYGLRMVNIVNISEYMETSVQAGLRLTIHDTTAVPFPDVFGFNAPTGFQTSFGIRLRKINRNGNCTNLGKDAGYIYQDYDYSVEGCSRSCYQVYLVKECGCGDPRFPILANQTHCPSDNKVAKDCLDRQIAELGGVAGGGGKLHCQCKSPCVEWLYEVSSSQALWPSGSSSSALDCDLIEQPNDQQCIDYYKKHAAMIEVYYERTGYEWMSESEAYGWVTALADVGGHMGMITGISIITLVEFFVLIYDLFTACCSKSRQI